jgi:predicted ATP-binding protein involved in virulence
VGPSGSGKTKTLQEISAEYDKNVHNIITIIKVADKFQGDIIEEDPKLLMWHSNGSDQVWEGLDNYENISWQLHPSPGAGNSGF